MVLSTVFCIIYNAAHRIIVGFIAFLVNLNISQLIQRLLA